MKNPSLSQSLPALIAVTGAAAIGTAERAEAAHAAPSARLDAIETRVKNVRAQLEQGVAFAKVPATDGLQTFWWGNWHNGGWGPGVWHNWGNGGWHNWRNGWGNGGWHNWHNWHNF